MGWSEIETSQSIQVDADGNLRGARVYRVWGSGYTRSMVITDPTAIVNSSNVGLPDLGSSWLGMKLDAYEVVPLGSIFDVTALYSNNKKFVGFGGNFRNDDLFKSWGGGTGTYRVSIPFARYKSIRLYVGQPPTEKIVETYVFGENNAEAKMRFIRREVNVNTSNNIGQAGGITIYNTPQVIAQTIEASYEQFGKLHKIRGRWYRYKGADFTQTSQKRWVFEHKWEQEAGVYARPVPIGPADPRYILPSDRPDTLITVPWLSASKPWVVPPFHTVTVVPGNASTPPLPSDVPKFRIVTEPDYSDPLGWTMLPGVVE